MKVGKNSVSSSSYVAASGAYKKNKRVESSARVNDSVEVSASGSLFQKAIAELDGVPDIRMEAVSGIQQELNEGRYHRNEYDVAEKVIEDHLTAVSSAL